MIHHAQSIDDPALELFRNLRDRDLRGNHDSYVVESPRVVQRFLQSTQLGTHAVERLLLTPELLQEFETAISSLAPSIPINVAPLEVMHEISGYRFHGGALAIGSRRRGDGTLPALLSNLPQERCTLLIAQGVSNMDNVGSFFRHTAALGADGIILTDGCSDPLLRKSIRVSMGWVFSIPWATCASLSEAIPHLRELNIQCIALENLPEAISLEKFSWPKRSALLAGNEGHGLDSATIALCDYSVRIPGPANCPDTHKPGGSDERSLNVSAAAAIALYARNACETS